MIVRSTLSLACIAFGLLLTACSSPASFTVERGLPIDDTAASAQVAEQLKKPIALPSISGPLDQALATWSHASGVPLDVQWGPLVNANVDRNLPVSVTLHGTPAHVVLDQIARACGEYAILEPLSWTVANGVVRFSTRRELDRSTVLRVYDIRRFFRRFRNSEELGLEFNYDNRLSSTSTGLVIMKPEDDGDWCVTCRSSSRGAESPPLGPTYEEVVEQVTTLIQDTVGSQSEWAAYGGDVSTLREMDGRMWIKTTWRNHREIEALLAELMRDR